MDARGGGMCARLLSHATRAGTHLLAVLGDEFLVQDGTQGILPAFGLGCRVVAGAKGGLPQLQVPTAA